MNYGKKGVRARQRALNSKVIKVERKFLLTVMELTLVAVIGLTIWGVAAGIGLYRGILASAPPIRLGDIVATGQATIVYDNAGNEIDQYVTTNSNRIPVASIDMLPEYLGYAFVAIEDERFFQHNGIDFEGIGRAGFIFIKSAGKVKQGGSTITQQLLKNTVFTTWTEENDNMVKMMKRKLQEQFLALEIEKYYSKNDILLNYMNAINLGQNTLGVEAAAQRYFGKSASDLTISECAVIASITQSPTFYNPIRHADNNKQRRKKCLNNMKKLGFITPEQYAEAIADTDAVYDRISIHNIDFQTSTYTTAGSYFSDAVYAQVKKDLVEVAGYSEIMAENLLTSGGLRIESTMDPTIQAIADEEFANPDNYPSQVDWYLNYALTIFDAEGQPHNFSQENMTSWFKSHKNSKFSLIFRSTDDADEAIETYRAAMMEELGVENIEGNYEESISMTAQPQAAMVIQDQRTGYVVAMVGGRGAKEGRRTLNRATNALRSPGSTFKPLAAFAPALDSAGQTLATVYNDVPFNYNDGTSVDSYTSYRGIQSIRDAITRSLNIVSVKCFTVITPQLGYDYLINFGFSTLTTNYVNYEGKVFTDLQQTTVLGGLTHGVSPYEVNAAYASIANMGVYVTPKLYSRVTDSDGNVILDNTTPASRRVIKETTAFLLTDAMVDVMTASGGTGRIANFSGMTLAGKSGTSTGPKDVWFTGFSPYYTCTVWSGYDNAIIMKNDGTTDTAKKLWRAVMSRVHENLTSKPFEKPLDIVQAQICIKSGKLPIEGLCDLDPANIRTEYFADGTVPEDSCDVHYRGDICEYDMLPASAECPFRYYDTLTLPLLEHPALIPGSTSIIINPDGTQTVVQPRTTNQCQHDAFFYENPDCEAIQNRQQWEIEQRRIAAAAQAQAEAEAAGAQ